MVIEVLAVGQDEQDAYDAQQAELASKNNNGTNGNLSTEPDKSQDAPVATESQEADKSTVDKPDGKDNPDEPDKDKAPDKEDDAQFYFGDTPVDIEVPAEISEALNGAKIDEAALVKELFAKDGKFEVSEKTKQALDKAFGKPMVDGYLNLFRQQNQIALDGYKKEAADMEASIKANSEDFATLVGGDDGWNELAEWAGENLSEAELGQFNAVMQLPPQHYQAQRAVIEALKIKQGAAVAAANGDKSVTLPTDSGDSSGNRPAGLPATLTKEEFQLAMRTERYQTDRKYAEAIDNIRRASQKKGIK